MQPDVRPATADDVRRAIGQNPPVSVRAWTLLHKGQPVGVGGYFVAGARVVVFSELESGLPKMTIWRAAKALMEQIKSPAVCRSSNAKLMERLGWRCVEGDVFECN